MRRRGAQGAGGVRAALVTVAAWCLVGAAPSQAQPFHPSTELKRARDAFEYGDYARTVAILEPLGDMSILAVESERIDGFKLRGLSHFYLEEPTIEESRGQAREAFFGLLKQNPDYELDPFYVPPDAVAFFDMVRAEEEPYLAPIRRARHARLREQELEEQARREAERLRRERMEQLAARPVVIERELLQSSTFVAWMPFGLGQFQNGHVGLGTTLLTLEAGAAATSIVCYWLIEGLRDPETRRFSEGNLRLAQRLDVAKWIGAGLFYALWLAGGIDANWRMVPNRVVREGPATSIAPASAVLPSSPSPLDPAPTGRAPTTNPAPLERREGD